MKEFFKLLWRIWLKIGDILAWCWTIVLLTVVYFVVLGPIAIIMKILRKDPLKYKFSKESYWLELSKDTSEESFYHQF